MKRTKLNSLIAVLLVVALCFSTNVSTASAAKKKSSKVKVTSVTVKAPSGSKKVAYVAKGKKITLTTTVKAKPNKKANKKVTYKSANTKIATVSKKGVVKGKKLGTTKVTVTSAKNTKKKKTIKITVTNPVKKVTLNKKNLTLSPNGSEKLKVTVKAPKKNSYKGVKWTTSNKKVATVTKKGVVKAVGEGTAKITVKALDGSGKKAVCKVSVWNGMKSMEVFNPKNSYYVSAFKVTLDAATALTEENFTVKVKSFKDGQYQRERKVEKVFTNDNVNYTVYTESSVSMGEYVQVSVPSLKGTNAIEQQVLADGYESTTLIRGMVGEDIENYTYNNYFGFDNLVGYTSVSVKSGSLPAGLEISKYYNQIEGTPTAVANNQIVTLEGTDELGRKASEKINFLIGDKNYVVAENSTIGDQPDALIYPHDSVSKYMYAEGGSGKYYVTLEDSCNDIFSLYDVNSEYDDNNNLRYYCYDDVGIQADRSKLEAGTYNVKVKFADYENPASSAVGTLTVVVTKAVAVTTIVYNYNGNNDNLMFYNHDLDETFSYYYDDATTDYDKRILTAKTYLPTGNYSVYVDSYGKDITLAKYINIGGDTVLSYTLPTRTTISGSLTDKNGAKLVRDAVVRLYKADEVDEGYVASDYYYSEGKYEFKDVPNGSYIIKVYDYDTGEYIATTGTINVSGTNIIEDFFNLPVDSYSYDYDY